MATDILEGYALSPQQERVWVLQQGAQGLPYRAQCAVRVDGPLDLQVFTTALQQVVERHEMLRTTFQRGVIVLFPTHIGQSSNMLFISKSSEALPSYSTAQDLLAMRLPVASFQLDLEKPPLS
jgi:hypothetical protein